MVRKYGWIGVLALFGLVLLMAAISALSSLSDLSNVSSTSLTLDIESMENMVEQMPPGDLEAVISVNIPSYHDLDVITVLEVRDGKGNVTEELGGFKSHIQIINANAVLTLRSDGTFLMESQTTFQLASVSDFFPIEGTYARGPGGFLFFFAERELVGETIANEEYETNSSFRAIYDPSGELFIQHQFEYEPGKEVLSNQVASEKVAYLGYESSVPVAFETAK